MIAGNWPMCCAAVIGRLPDVPTFKEQGLEGMNASAFMDNEIKRYGELIKISDAKME